MFFNLFKIIKTLSPRSDCLLCTEPVSTSSVRPKLLCHHCHSRLPTSQSGCPVCAMPLTQSLKTACGECLKNTPGYHRTVAAFHYEPPVSHFITQLKFNGKRHFVPLLSDYLLDAIHQQYQVQELPEAIIPVPLHNRKIRQRGFNQAHLIAQRLARQLHIPVLAGQAKRIRYTQAQSALNATQRQKNLRGAFAIEPLRQKTVAIVDDVVTTGATVDELSHQLIRVGASRVDVWCIARAFSA